MSRYWSHVAMLLLGVTLTVGAYEGRRLVKNTAKALSAASQLTTGAAKRQQRLEEEEPSDEGELAAAEAPVEEPKKARKKRSSRKSTNRDRLSREEKLAILEARRAQRAQRIDALRARMPAQAVRGPDGALPVRPTAMAVAPSEAFDRDLLPTEPEFLDTGLPPE